MAKLRELARHDVGIINGDDALCARRETSLIAQVIDCAGSSGIAAIGTKRGVRAPDNWQAQYRRAESRL